MENSTIKTYKDLIVWKKAMAMVVMIYELTENFPKSELYGLSIQMRRASVSIPSNIAEGRRRGSRKEFRHFLLNSLGSGAELETQIEIVKRLSFGGALDCSKIEALLDEVMRMLSRMISSLSNSQQLTTKS